jgi:hypothetical protein
VCILTIEVATLLHVTTVRVQDWLSRAVPHPGDPTMSLYGAAVHNAHVDCSHCLIGGLLSANERDVIDAPQGVPRSMADFERGSTRAQVCSPPLAVPGSTCYLLNIKLQPDLPHPRRLVRVCSSH